jgi:cytochrome c553
MRKIAFLLLFSGSILCHAAENEALNQDKSIACVACHGANGVSPSPEWPNLAGQHKEYLIKQMTLFKEGKKRNNPLMVAPMANLTSQDISELADYYSKQPLAKLSTPKEYLKKGEQLYRGGDFSKHISACIACHGPRGLGNPQANFPVLSGQQPMYTIQTLEAYQNGTRTSDMNEIMRNISKRMSKEDMEAVAYYVSGLH